MPVVAARTLEDFSAQLLARGGLAADEARTVARSLVGANLRGHDSHGVMRIPYYVENVEKREMVSGAALEVIHQTDATVTADGGWGPGQVQAHRLFELLIPPAQQHGVAVGTLRRCGHVGRLGEYCEAAAERGLVSMMMVNTHGTARRVAPVGGTSPRLGTNPLAIGVPNGATPLVLDFGTSAVAEGKVRVRRIAGEPCPPGWLLDSHGVPTCDPTTLYGDPPGTILPFGGEQAYKGFGLALMIEIFAGALSQGVCAREKPLNQVGNCVYLQLIDPARLGGSRQFQRQIADLVQFLRECPRADGVEQITLPGDPERSMLAERMAHGIPIDDGNWRPLVDLARRLGVSAVVAS